MRNMFKIALVRHNRALLLLLGATAATYFLSHDNSAGVLAGIGTLVIACIKARLVVLDFMELRHAPPLWRLGWQAGLFIMSATLVAIYVFGGIDR